MTSKKLVFGKGVCSQGQYAASHDGKLTKTYQTWCNMLSRCYNLNANNINYLGCYVVDEWLEFQVFAEWLHKQEHHDNPDYQLDKDLLVKGNKAYSPETCVLLPYALNSLLTDSAGSRGDYPIGVHYSKSKNRYVAQISVNGKRKHIGYYSDAASASRAYVEAKEKQVKAKALEYMHKIDIKAFTALMDWCSPKHQSH